MVCLEVRLKSALLFQTFQTPDCDECVTKASLCGSWVVGQVRGPRASLMQHVGQESEDFAPSPSHCHVLCRPIATGTGWWTGRTSWGWGRRSSRTAATRWTTWRPRSGCSTATTTGASARRSCARRWWTWASGAQRSKCSIHHHCTTWPLLGGTHARKKTNHLWERCKWSKSEPPFCHGQRLLSLLAFPSSST